MKPVFKLISFIIAVALTTNVSLVSASQIFVKGRMFGHTCDIAVNGISTPAVATVKLPTISTSLLDNLGDTAGRTDFKIELTNCSGTALSAAVFFEAGAGVDPISGHLINTGTATNVRLQLLDNTAGNFVVIKAGDSSQLDAATPVPFDSMIAGKATLAYAVEYIATDSAGANPGSVLGTVTYSIDYR